MTQAGQTVYKLLFLVAIYISWATLYCCTKALIQIIQRRTSYNNANLELFETIKLKLIRGLVEIIKYTYSGFCGAIFTSLVCVKLKSNYVWWYDASNICLERWQLLIVLFGVTYALPFPIALYLGMRFLKTNRISSGTFLLCCTFPILSFILFPISIKKSISISHAEGIKVDMDNTALSKEILSVLQGPYKSHVKQVAMYWEAVISMRRFLLSTMTLLGYASIRMVIILCLNGIFLLHHMNTFPFQAQLSNQVESISLLLLMLVAALNLLKASLTDSGVIPSGPSVPFFKGLEFMEKICVVVLIGSILFGELWIKFRGKTSKRNAKHI